ncbi:ATP-dependent helicase, partial [Escherichia coli]|nr:ATP-dependent helicase [Escherichia coli]
GWCAHTFREKFGEWPDGLSNFPMEITPEVNNYIRHKLIRFAKGHQRVQKVTENAQTTIDLSQERDERREIPAGSEAWRTMQAKHQLQKNINSLSQ